jgi:hypothetical protein
MTIEVRKGKKTSGQVATRLRGTSVIRVADACFTARGHPRTDPEENEAAQLRCARHVSAFLPASFDPQPSSPGQSA